MVAISFGVIAAYRRLELLQNVRWQKWFLWFSIGSLFDWATTTLCYLMLGDAHDEGNPLARYLFEQYGFGIGLLIHGSIVTALMLAVGITLGKRHAYARLALLVGMIFRFYATVANVYLLFS